MFASKTPACMRANDAQLSEVSSQLLSGLRLHCQRATPAPAKALVLEEHGEPKEVLRLRTHSVRECGPSDILLRMLAAPVNPSDINTVQGLYPLQPQEGIPGHEGVAEVVAVGANVSRLKAGDRVVPLEPGLGMWRTQGVFSEHLWHPVSSQLRLADAACLVINPLTALGMLEELVELQPGDCVVQNGGNSAVGQHVVALAKARGVHTISIVRDRLEWRETERQLMQLGADLVVRPEHARSALKGSGLPPPKLGLNCTGGELSTLVLKMLAKGGTMATYGAMAKQPVVAPAPLLIYKDCKLQGFWCSGNSKTAQDQEAKKQALDRAGDLMLQGLMSTRCEEIPFVDWHRAFDAHAKKPLLVMQ